jgi:hypothetical protein
MTCVLRHTSIVFLSLWVACCAPAFADGNTDKNITDFGLREARDIMSRELLGHYDLTNLAVLELLPAADRDGSWRTVSPHWRSRRPYPLRGYLRLEGREEEGYVLFPKQRGR